MTETARTFASGSGTLLARPAEKGTWIVSWSNPGPDLVQLIESLFSELEAERLVHLGAEGDYADLRVARQAGFVAEGIERTVEQGQPTTWWRSARLRTDRDGALATVIDGSRPAHLVGEFHQVYDLPNLVGTGFTPTVDFDRLDLRMSLIKEEFAELCGAVYGDAAEETLLRIFPQLPDDRLRDVVEAADALGDLTYVIYGMALEAGIDLDRVVAEVHRSNLSKLMPDGTVKRREDGKVLKGPDFSAPDIAGVLGR